MRVEFSVRIYGLVRVFGIIIGPATGQVPRLLMCSWSVSFHFPWFSGGCVFSSCWFAFWCGSVLSRVISLRLDL